MLVFAVHPGWSQESLHAQWQVCNGCGAAAVTAAIAAMGAASDEEGGCTQGCEASCDENGDCGDCEEYCVGWLKCGALAQVGTDYYYVCRDN